MEKLSIILISCLIKNKIIKNIKKNLQKVGNVYKFRLFQVCSFSERVLILKKHSKFFNKKCHANTIILLAFKDLANIILECG